MFLKFLHYLLTILEKLNGAIVAYLAGIKNMAVSMKRTDNFRDFEAPASKKYKDDSTEELNNRFEVVAAIVRKLTANAAPARIIKFLDSAHAPPFVKPAGRKKPNVQRRKRQPTRKLQQAKTNQVGTSPPNNYYSGNYSLIACTALEKNRSCNNGSVAERQGDGRFFNATNAISVQSRSPQCPLPGRQTTRSLPLHIGKTLLLLSDGEVSEKVIAAPSVEAVEMKEADSVKKNNANSSSSLSDSNNSSSDGSSSTRREF